MSSIEVKVKFYAMLREATGKKMEIIKLPAKLSVGDLITLLVERYGDDFGKYIYDLGKEVRDYLSFMLNGININSLDGLNTMLRDGDVLSLLPPVGGG